MLPFNKKNILIVILIALVCLAGFLWWFLAGNKLNKQGVIGPTASTTDESFRVFVEAPVPKNLNGLSDEQNKQYGLNGRSVDSDGDGLNDKLELRFGTDPKKADSDGDGFGDAQEILNGYNPLGEGKL